MMHQGVIAPGGPGTAVAGAAGMPSGWWIVPGVLVGLGFWVMVGIGLHGAFTSGTDMPALVTQGQSLGVAVTAPE